MRADIRQNTATRRLVVTGASGLLGANFALAAAHRFAVTGLYGRHLLQIPGTVGHAIDLRSGEEVVRQLDAIAPAVLVHLAAETNVDYCENHRLDAVTLNVDVTRRLAEWASANGCRFVLMSTDLVFDGRRGGYTEDDEPGPLNWYAETKVAAERAVRDLVSDHLIVRASFFGWNAQRKMSLSEWILQRLENAQPLPGFVDVVFSPLLANTLARFMLDLLDLGARGTIHLASADPISKHEFAAAIAELFDLPSGLITECALADAKLVASRPLNTCLRPERARREFGIVAPTVREELKELKRLRDRRYPSFLRDFNMEQP